MWNRDGRFQGQTDVPLSDEGRAQALALARVLGGVTFDVAMSSDLSRAFDTAQAICGDRVRADVRWREFDFGEWEGMTWAEICARWPQYGAEELSMAQRYAPPGGETFDALCARVGEAVDDLRAGGFAHALVVTHAGPLHAMLAQWFPQVRVRFVPASITAVHVDAGAAPQLLALNEAAHVEQMEPVRRDGGG